MISVSFEPGLFLLATKLHRPHVRRHIARIDDNTAKYGNFEPRALLQHANKGS